MKAPNKGRMAETPVQMFTFFTAVAVDSFKTLVR